MSIPKSALISEVWKKGIFRDKVVFCTGGNGSICSMQVQALVYLGANACIVGRNVDKTALVARRIGSCREGSKILGLGGVDVRNIESLKNAVDRCIAELGSLDFLIAGAAGNFLSPLHKLSSNAFKSVIDIDVLGSYNVTKLVLPHLVKSVQKHKFPSTMPSGRIIYLSATLHYTGLALQTHASVAKAGVDALSANVAIEYGPLGITSNVIAPGPISGTEGLDRLSKKLPGGDSNSARQIPLGRFGDVKDIADATVFLFSDAANYVNGTVIVVDGAAWRTGSGDLGTDHPYPDSVLDFAERASTSRGKL